MDKTVDTICTMTDSTEASVDALSSDVTEGAVVPPPSAGPDGAVVPPAHAETHSEQASARPAITFRMVFSPLVSGRREGGGAWIINPDRELSERFCRILYRDNDPREALRFCAERLARLSAEDTDGHLRWGNNYAVAQAEAGDFRGALATHYMKRPLTARSADPFLIGNHHHGLGYALRELGRYVEARGEFQTSRLYHVRADVPEYVASDDNNAALAWIASGEPAKAHPLIDRAQRAWERLGLFTLVGQAEDTRAICFLKEGKPKEAREAICRALDYLEGSGEKLALEQALKTWREIEEAIRAR